MSFFGGYFGGSGSNTTTTYRMRARDTSSGEYVYWDSNDVPDATGALYTGTGPLTDIVVQNKISKTV